MAVLETNTAVQQFAISVNQQLTVSTNSVSFQVRDGQRMPGSIVVTVSGKAQNKPITFTQTQDWIFATIQTTTAGAAIVCCPTTIIASVDQSAFKSPGSYTGSLGIIVPGFNPGKLDYAVLALAPTPLPMPLYDPDIQLKSIANAASFGQDIAAGSIVSLFGANMADGTYSASNLPLS